MKLWAARDKDNTLCVYNNKPTLSKESVFKFKLNYLKEKLAQLQERCTIQTENITNLTKSFNNN